VHVVQLQVWQVPPQRQPSIWLGHSNLCKTTVEFTGVIELQCLQFTWFQLGCLRSPGLQTIIMTNINDWMQVGMRDSLPRCVCCVLLF